ncbi:hypothetical protein TTRE_0000066801 [Trichuris trichiura]|uniref:Uncharacterized protein n=1 Tax=Trichuris trichiura TaxID=36087 RepID=A0A077YXB0_TRITR|nr:hypothetical protein TTRE_0000066801 [Trichuris trichiura]
MVTTLSKRRRYLHTKVIYDAAKLFLKCSNVPVQIVVISASIDGLYLQLCQRWEKAIFRFVEVIRLLALIAREGMRQVAPSDVYKQVRNAMTTADLHHGVHHITNRYVRAELNVFHLGELVDVLMCSCKLSAGVPTLFLFGDLLEYTHVYELSRILEVIPITFLKCAVVIQEQRGRRDGATASLPFNEYELWHFLCARVVFVVGSSFNLYMNKLLSTFGRPALPVQPDIVFWGHVKARKVVTSPPYNQDRINCRCVALGDHIVIIGGLVHCEKNVYRTCENVILFDAQKQSIREANVMNVDCLKKITNRVHHSVTRVAGDSFVVFGGWKDHFTAQNDCWHGQLVTENELRFAAMSLKGTKIGLHPWARWRHGACLVENVCSSSSAVFICGGLTRRFGQVNAVHTFAQVLKDAWTLEWEYGIWRRLPDLPVPLHSHQCSYVANESLVVAIGGLSAMEDQFSAKIYFFSLSSLFWLKEIDLEPRVGRYGFTSHALTEEVLLLVGGVNERFEKCNTLTLVNLKNGKTISFAVDLDQDLESSSSDAASFAFINHCSALVNTDDKVALYVFGGGENFLQSSSACSPFFLHVDLPSLSF